MSKLLACLLFVFTIGAVGFVPPAAAQETVPGITWEELDPKLKKQLLRLLKKFDGGDVISERNPPLGLAAKKGDTSGCPSSCNDSYSGGMCRCTEDEDGNCPGGSSNPGTGNECTTTKDSYKVIMGGRKEPLRLLGPDLF